MDVPHLGGLGGQRVRHLRQLLVPELIFDQVGMILQKILVSFYGLSNSYFLNWKENK
jgi:hypothetical protein